MNKLLKILLVGVIILVTLASIILYRDYNSFYVGKSYFKYKNRLPYNIYPIHRYEFEGSPSLNDEHGMPIVGRFSTFEYDNKIHEINRLIKYTVVDDYKIIALVETNTNDYHYVEIIKISTVICEVCFTVKGYDFELNKLEKLNWHEFD